jgi:thiaminase/transcriptional activator TenA
LKLHSGYAARLGIDLTRVEPLLATSAYTDFLLATASLGNVGETCAAMTPCMRLYAFLGQSLADRAVDRNPYAEWIRTYADREFEALAARLEGLLDRYAQGPRIAEIYRRAMRLELAFFEAPFGSG